VGVGRGGVTIERKGEELFGQRRWLGFQGRQ